MLPAGGTSREYPATCCCPIDLMPNRQQHASHRIAECLKALETRGNPCKQNVESVCNLHAHAFRTCNPGLNHPSCECQSWGLASPLMLTLFRWVHAHAPAKTMLTSNKTCNIVGCLQPKMSIWVQAGSNCGVMRCVTCTRLCSFQHCTDQLPR